MSTDALRPSPESDADPAGAGDRPDAAGPDGSEVSFDAVVRIDTPGERNYYVNGGIMQFVLRNLARD